MKQSRKLHESSDFSAEDRHAHKYSRRSEVDRDKHLTDDMASHHRSSAEGRGMHNTKQARHSHDKRSADDMARDNTRESRNSHSHRRSEGTGSDLSDEVLIKDRPSRRPHRDTSKDDIISRQLKNIEKAQREALRPSSASSQEIHVHYVPIITTSASPPLASSRQARSHPPSTSESGGQAIRKSKSASVCAGEITSQLRDLTLSLLKKRDHSHSRSRRGKCERRDKHGKKKSVSKFLAPLTQRWVCYGCGKLRSDMIQDRHPLKEGQKMQPNWCGKCRVHGELHGRPLSWAKQRHYCWGCGIVRSKDYHRENPIGEDEISTPNYCKPCRELSPSFDYCLREASEIGSEISIRDKAFSRQMYDAELSDIDEDKDEQPTTAPGKENQDPQPRKCPKATRSFILKHCSFQTKTASDASSEGSMPLSVLKVLDLDDGEAKGFSSGGVRLSVGSYKPPSVEATVNGCSSLGVEDLSMGQNNEGATSRHVSCEMGDVGAAGPYHNEETIKPTVGAPTQRTTTTVDSPRKKVHWIKDDCRPMTAEFTQPYYSDSGLSSGYRSDISMKSAGSRGRRRNPAAISQGSPPEREGAITVGDIGGDLHKSLQHEDSWTQWPASNNNDFGRGTASQGASSFPVREQTYNHDKNVYSSAAARSQTLSGFPGLLPRTSPESSDSVKAGASTLYDRIGSQNVPSSEEYGSQSPVQEFPNFSRPYLSPGKSAHGSPDHSYGNPVSSPGYGTRPDYQNQAYTFRSNAQFSDSTTRRDFSGFEAPDFDVFSSPDNDRDASSGAGEFFASTLEHDDYSYAAPPNAGQAAFDFTLFGETGGSSTSEPAGEKFVRAKKSTTGSQTSNRQSWHLYDDGDAEEGKTGGCKWRRDGRTTVHRAGQTSCSGKGVAILSIREITSDDDLSSEADSKDDDDIDDSELDTVVNAEIVKSIGPA